MPGILPKPDSSRSACILRKAGQTALGETYWLDEEAEHRFLTVNSLRADRLNAGHNGRIVATNLHDLAAAGLTAEASYTLSSSTVGSLPSIMTSTRPLSYGGFDRGVFARPVMLGTHLAAHGYHSTHIATVHWVDGRISSTREPASENSGLVRPALSQKPATHRSGMRFGACHRVGVTDLTRGRHP